MLKSPGRTSDLILHRLTSHRPPTPWRGPGSRHADLQDAIWVPLGLFLVEWLLIVMWAYRHKDYVRLDETNPECKLE